MKENWKKELENYIESKEHQNDCIGHSEGQECCLEKEWIREFIQKLLEGE